MNRKAQPDTQGNLKDLAYRRLKGMLFAGDVSADKPFAERQLSQELGISRTPIKHALSMLEQEGLVRIVPRKGVFLQRLSYLEYQNMLSVREVLEGLAARLAVDNVANVHLRQLRRLLEPAAAGGEPIDHQEYALMNVAFHRAVLELSHNPVLMSTVRGLYDHLSLVRLRTIEFAGRRERSEREHEAIMKALERRDPDLAEATMREHIRSLRSDIAREIRRNPSYLDNFEGEMTPRKTVN